MRSYDSTSSPFDCKAVVDEGLPAIAEAASIDNHLTVLNDLSINFMDGERYWDVLGSDNENWNSYSTPGQKKKSILDQTISTVEEVIGNIGCRMKIDVSDRNVNATCHSYRCVLGEVAIGGGRTSGLNMGVPIPNADTENKSDS